MTWLKLPGRSRTAQSAQLVDCYLLTDLGSEYEGGPCGVDPDIPFGQHFADISHQARTEFRCSGGLHDTCYVSALTWNAEANRAFPAISQDFRDDPLRDRRMIFVLSHYNCTRAARCVQHLLDVADLRVRHPNEYTNARKFKKEAIQLTKRVVEATEQFFDDLDSAADYIRDSCGLSVYIEPY